MISIPSVLLALTVFAFGVYATAHTSFGRGRMDPGPFWVHSLLEVPILILPGVVMTSFEGVRELWIFSNVDDTAYSAAIWAVYYGLVGYFATVLVADKLLCRVVPPPHESRPAKDQARLAGLVLTWQCLTLTALLAFVRASPLVGLFTGADVGVLRKAATIEFGGPAALLSLVRIYGLLGVFLLAATRKSLRRRMLRTLLWTTSLLCLSWSGEKSPAVLAVLGYWFLRAHHERRRITLMRLLVLAALASLVSLGIFSLLRDASNDLSVVEFFGIRTFLGQISGFFQTVSNFTPNPKYMLSWIPFSGAFSHHLPVFARDLMLMTEGDTETSGTLNTLFLGEAYGAGGWPMLLASPFIVAISVVLSLHLLRRWLTRQVGSEFAKCGAYLFVMNAWLTSGMASFPAFRGLIVVGFVLATVVVPYRMLRRPSRSVRHVSQRGTMAATGGAQ
jgi:hypothetical protein